MKKLKFTKGELNLAEKFSIDLSDEALGESKILSAENPFSGDTVMLNPTEYKIYHIVMQLYSNISFHGGGDVRTYDRLKYLLLKINPEAYMKLID